MNNHPSSLRDNNPLKGLLALLTDLKLVDADKPDTTPDQCQANSELTTGNPVAAALDAVTLEPINSEPTDSVSVEEVFEPITVTENGADSPPGDMPDSPDLISNLNLIKESSPTLETPTAPTAFVDSQDSKVPSQDMPSGATPLAQNLTNKASAAASLDYLIQLLQPYHDQPRPVEAKPKLELATVPPKPGLELGDVKMLLYRLEDKLNKIENQIYTPAQLMELLLPMIADLLALKVATSKQEVIEAITPIIDEVIEQRIEQDREAMSEAIAPIISAAISTQIQNSPEEIANAIGPTMGKAIQEQIRVESDAMIDALYPIIGSTISKYMREAVAAINRQVETAFSIEGLRRKVQAKLQGVSEAELILRESMPFQVVAAFLIHKASGLIMAEAQPADQAILESDMLAGMLTAIRSFANDCMTSSPGELNEIDYSDSKIVLEVAGYCYLALVVKGDLPPAFVKKVRQIMATIVRIYNKPIAAFNGDRTTIPNEIYLMLADIVTGSESKSKSRFPAALLSLILGLLAVIFLPFGFYQHQQFQRSQLENKVLETLEATPELSIYRLNVRAEGNRIILRGRLPSTHLRDRATTVSRSALPNYAIDNQIVPVSVEIDPDTTATEVRQAVKVLNQMPGILISATYQNGQVEITGIVSQRDQIIQATQVMQNIPGVNSILNRLKVGKVDLNKISSRIMFSSGSADFQPTTVPQIVEIRDVLQVNRDWIIKITGYADNDVHGPEFNQRLALERANSVRQALISQGVDPKQITTAGVALFQPPNQDPQQSRFVDFELITATKN